MTSRTNDCEPVVNPSLAITVIVVEPMLLGGAMFKERAPATTLFRSKVTALVAGTTVVLDEV